LKRAVRKTDFGETVGSSEFLFLLADGSKRKVLVRVGKPYKDADGPWRCPCELAGFEPRYVDMAGADSMQALCLAVSVVRRRLEHFIEDGGRIFYESGEELSLKGIRSTFSAVGS
jgi:hypothetical protein